MAVALTPRWYSCCPNPAVRTSAAAVVEVQTRHVDYLACYPSREPVTRCYGTVRDHLSDLTRNWWWRRKVKCIAVQPRGVGWPDARLGLCACVEILCIRSRARTRDVLTVDRLYWPESAAGCSHLWTHLVGPSDENISTATTMLGLAVGWSGSAAVDAHFRDRTAEVGERTFRWS